MQAPVDYPLNDAAHTAEFAVDELAYAVMLDRNDLHAESPEPAITAADHHFKSMSGIKRRGDHSGFRSVPKPLAAIAQTLIAGESSQRTADTTSMFSRLARTGR